MLYTLNLYSDVHRVYIDKTRKKKKNTVTDLG